MSTFQCQHCGVFFSLIMNTKGGSGGAGEFEGVIVANAISFVFPPHNMQDGTPCRGSLEPPPREVVDETCRLHDSLSWE